MTFTCTPSQNCQAVKAVSTKFCPTMCLLFMCIAIKVIRFDLESILFCLSKIVLKWIEEPKTRLNLALTFISNFAPLPPTSTIPKLQHAKI